ncbi:MAG: hypothetical protein RLZZ598_1318 [Pseudomonadota bacterium]|jgi:hypothetical protein
MKRSPLFLLSLAGGLLATPAWSKLPPPTPQAQLKADEAKTRAAWSDKVAAYQLCKSMDRVAAYERESARAAGKDVKAPTETPACIDPGPFVPPTPMAMPTPSSGTGGPAPGATPPATAKIPAAPAPDTRK